MSIFRRGKKEERPVIEKISRFRLGPFSSVIANPTDEVILIRDGEIIDTYGEKRFQARTLFGSLRAMFGVGRDVTVLRIDLRPFNVEMSFGEHPPPVKADPMNYVAPDSTGEHASMGVLLEVVFDPDTASKALWISDCCTCFD